MAFLNLFQAFFGGFSPDDVKPMGKPLGKFGDTINTVYFSRQSKHSFYYLGWAIYIGKHNPGNAI